MRTQAVGRNFRVLAAVALALLSPRLLGAEAKPLIGVELRIEATNFRRNLHRHINDVEKYLASLVADLSADRHGFLSWQPLSQVRDRSQLAAILHVSLIQGDGGFIMLRFSAEAGRAGTHFECFEGAVEPVSFESLKDLERQLYSPLDPQPTGNAALLQERIQTVLKGTGFRDALGGVFASKIPICHDAKPIEAGLVAIGLKQSELHVAENSKMELSLCSLDQGKKWGGILGLAAATRTGIYSKSPKEELIQGRVSSCKFGGSENELCKSKIRLMFQEKIDHSLDVVMIDFVPSYPSTLGSQVTLQ